MVVPIDSWLFFLKKINATLAGDLRIEHFGLEVGGKPLLRDATMTLVSELSFFFFFFFLYCATCVSFCFVLFVCLSSISFSNFLLERLVVVDMVSSVTTVSAVCFFFVQSNEIQLNLIGFEFEFEFNSTFSNCDDFQKPRFCVQWLSDNSTCRLHSRFFTSNKKNVWLFPLVCVRLLASYTLDSQCWQRNLHLGENQVMSALDCVLACDAERTELLDELEKATGNFNWFQQR